MDKILSCRTARVSVTVFTVAALAACSKDLGTQLGLQTGGSEITICTDISKTTIDGYSTKWAAGDAINVFHAAAGTSTYSTNSQFTISEDGLASGRFTGTLSGTLADNNDWYALYPYESHITTPANTGSGWMYIGCGNSSSTAQVQTGINSTAHLAGQYFPLYAKAGNVAGTGGVSLSFKPALSIVKFHVTNATSKAVTVSSLSMTAQEDIIGSYYIDFSGAVPVFTPSKAAFVAKTAKLTVTDGVIAADGSADFYMAIKPFTNAAGSTLTFAVGDCEKTTTTAQTFESGKVKTVKISLTEEPAPTGSGWAELPSKPVKTDDYYYTEHFTDKSDASGNKIRNYSVCYSKEKWCAMWIAAPYHKSYTGSPGRNDSYKTDPNFDFTQPGKWDGYTRGHLLGSAERTVDVYTNRQVFYYSNIAPQLQKYFNTGGGAWNDCEDWINGQWEGQNDTTYVVTGCWWENATKTVSGTLIPTHYYKVILRTKNHLNKYVCNCTADELQCIVIYMPHRTYSSAHPVEPSEYESAGWLMSVSDLEKKTGFTYFVNVPNAPKDSYTLSDWGL